MYSPLAWAMPVFRVAATPRFISCLITRIRGSRELSDYFPRVVYGTVVNDDEFKISVCLDQHTIDRSGQECRPVISDDYDAYLRGYIS